MFRKALVLIPLFISLTVSLFAQTSVGVEGGLSYNSYRTNISNRSTIALEDKTGFGIASPIRYRIWSWLYGMATPCLIQKGYSFVRTDSLSGIYDQHTNLYLQLPVGIGLAHEWGRLSAGLDLGAYAGYWLYGRVKGATADIFGTTGTAGSEQFKLIGYNQSYSFNTQRDNRWEEGWWTGLDIRYRLTENFWLTAGLTYYEALSSQEKASINSTPAYNQTWLLSIGGSWTIPHLPHIR
jgi:hypothetical protein